MGDSSFSVNARGVRVTNEKTTYNDRTQSHFRWDPRRAEYPDFLQFAIFDERTRRLWPRAGLADHQAGNFIPPIGETSKYLMQADTLEELAAQLDGRLAALSAQSGGVRLSEDFVGNLRATIERFNEFARTGTDEDFHRGETTIELFMHGERAEGNDLPNPTLHPLADSGPYYAAILAPGSIETKGGPKVNARLQMLGGDDARSRGSTGSATASPPPSGQAYWSGGSTWGPYVTFGYVAAQSIVGDRSSRPRHDQGRLGRASARRPSPARRCAPTGRRPTAPLGLEGRLDLRSYAPEPRRGARSARRAESTADRRVRWLLRATSTTDRGCVRGGARRRRSSPTSAWTARTSSRWTPWTG